MSAKIRIHTKIQSRRMYRSYLIAIDLIKGRMQSLGF